MKRIIVLCLLLTGCIAKPAQHVVPAALAPTTPTASTSCAENPVCVNVPTCPPNVDSPECDAKRDYRDYKMHEQELNKLILEEFAEDHKTGGTLNRARRDRMDAIMDWMKKHKYA